jgi:Fe-S oxidoreductase
MASVVRARTAVDRCGELLDTLGPALLRGAAVVGLEPACVASFRDELPGLFPDHPVARRLQEQSFVFAEFLDRHAAQNRSAAETRRIMRREVLP